MTGSELIKELSMYPPDVQVVVSGSMGDFEIDGVDRDPDSATTIVVEVSPADV